MRHALFAALVLLPLAACGGRSQLRADMKPLAFEGAAAAPKPQEVKENLFKGDQVGRISEHDLRRLLQSPVYLEDKSRVGVVPVASGYGPDPDLPIVDVTRSLAHTLEKTGYFEEATEVSTDWPATGHINGLRELAARYRTEYLLLYRHRFVDRSWTNAWAISWVAIVPAFFVPHNTMETAGVLEATLFDVKTGTLLFTVFERVNAQADENAWQNERKRRELKMGLFEKAAEKLTKRVGQHINRLVAARPAPETGGQPALANPAPSAPRPSAEPARIQAPTPAPGA